MNFFENTIWFIDRFNFSIQDISSQKANHSALLYSVIIANDMQFPGIQSTFLVKNNYAKIYTVC